MKQLLTLLIIMSSQQLAKSQTFAPLGATWHYQTWCYEPTVACDHFTIESSHDTSLPQGKLGRIIQRRNSSGIVDSHSFVILFIEDLKLKFWEDDTAWTLFDYNVTAGDSYLASYPSNQERYDFVYGFYHNDSVSHQRVYVDSITQVFVDGKTLNKYFLHRRDTNAHKRPFTFTDIIGTEYLFFNYPMATPAQVYEGHFRCYEDIEIFYKSSIEDCDEIYDPNEPDDIYNIILYPNPAKDVVNFTVSLHIDLSFQSLSLYDLQGRLLKSNKFLSSSLYVRDLAPGIYIIRITLTYGKSMEMKFIKT